jgi:diguanylate cyclase (GGDEF)-like protein
MSGRFFKKGGVMEPGRTRILLVEDSDTDAQIVTDLLSEENAEWFELARESCVGDAARRVGQESFDVALLDLTLPDCSGVSAITRMRDVSLDLPIVVLSAIDDETLVSHALRQGAQEYFLKGRVRSRSLRRAILYAVERKRTEEHIHHIMRHDSVTNLPNRLFFHDRLELALFFGRRYQRVLAVLILDLDHFKTTNDTLGHSVGDKLLKHVAEQLKSSLRGSDTIARLGGDEFGVLLPEVKRPEDVSHVIRRMKADLESPLMIQDHELFVSASIGCSLYPNDGEDAETLLKNADAAMYRAKHKGRNTHQFYSPIMHKRATKRLELGNALRRAIQREEFLLHYQPQIDVEKGQIIGVEVLLRWMHPTWGTVPPDEFIPLAEEMGLILPIETWVLRSACEQARAWRIDNLKLGRVSVNLSNWQLNDESFVDTMKRIMIPSTSSWNSRKKPSYTT